MINYEKQTASSKNPTLILQKVCKMLENDERLNINAV